MAKFSATLRPGHAPEASWNRRMPLFRAQGFAGSGGVHEQAVVERPGDQPAGVGEVSARAASPSIPSSWAAWFSTARERGAAVDDFVAVERPSGGLECRYARVRATLRQRKYRSKELFDVATRIVEDGVDYFGIFTRMRAIVDVYDQSPPAYLRPHFSLACRTTPSSPEPPVPSTRSSPIWSRATEATPGRSGPSNHAEPRKPDRGVRRRGPGGAVLLIAFPQTRSCRRAAYRRRAVPGFARLVRRL